MYSFLDDYYCRIASCLEFGVRTSVFLCSRICTIVNIIGFPKVFPLFGHNSEPLHHSDAGIIFITDYSYFVSALSALVKIVLTVGIFSPQFFFFFPLIFFGRHTFHMYPKLTVVLLIDIATVEITIVARLLCCCCFGFV